MIPQAIAHNHHLPIDVRVGESEIQIESRVENINILDVVVTNGSCQAMLRGFADTNVSLEFGEVKKLIVLGRNGYDCSISEIEVVTDRGIYAFRGPSEPSTESRIENR
jgi:hypothetical protein